MLCAHGWSGQTQLHICFLRRILRSKKYLLVFCFCKIWNPAAKKANCIWIPPAFLPRTLSAGGKSAEAGRIHIPSQMFRPAESALVSFEKSSSKVYNYSTSSNLFGIKNMERFCGSQNRALIFAKTLSAYGGSREIPKFPPAYGNNSNQN